MLHTKVCRLLLLVPLLLTSCSESGPKAPVTPKTTKVGGMVVIDGEPAPRGQVELKLYSKGTEGKPATLVANCLVGEGGTYAFNSYREGDGAVPGEYVLSMEWLRPAPGVMYGPDKFLNNFNSPQNADPRFQIEVIDGQSLEIPIIEINMRDLKQKPIHQYATPAGKNKKR